MSEINWIYREYYQIPFHFQILSSFFFFFCPRIMKHVIFFCSWTLNSKENLSWLILTQLSSTHMTELWSQGGSLHCRYCPTQSRVKTSQVILDCVSHIYSPQVQLGNVLKSDCNPWHGHPVYMLWAWKSAAPWHGRWGSLSSSCLTNLIPDVRGCWPWCLHGSLSETKGAENRSYTGYLKRSLPT